MSISNFLDYHGGLSKATYPCFADIPPYCSTAAASATAAATALTSTALATLNVERIKASLPPLGIHGR